MLCGRRAVAQDQHHGVASEPLHLEVTNNRPHALPDAAGHSRATADETSAVRARQEPNGFTWAPQLTVWTMSPSVMPSATRLLDDRAVHPATETMRATFLSLAMVGNPC
jgi:hypothetical protein